MARWDHASAECIVHPNFWVCNHRGCPNGPTAASEAHSGADAVLVYRRFSKPPKGSNQNLECGAIVRLNIPGSNVHSFAIEWTVLRSGIKLEPSWSAARPGVYWRISALDMRCIAAPRFLRWSRGEWNENVGF